MKALLVSGGDIVDVEMLNSIGRNVDYILCADGGTDHCLNADLVPNIIIGDLDSITKDSLSIIQKKKIPLIKFPTRKDSTDTELSIDYLIQKNFKDITILGAIGNRMDHTLANIFLLKKLKDNNVEGRIIDNHNIIYLVDNKLIIDRKIDYFISIVPITDCGIIVSLEGFEYELDRAKIDFGSTFGISNRIKGSKAYIKIHEGVCLVFFSKD